jgi:hypothetical protein
MTVVRAAKKLGIKLPTARLIINKYRHSGTFTVKRRDQISSTGSSSSTPEVNQNDEEQEIIEDVPNQERGPLPQVMGPNWNGWCYYFISQ